VAASAPEALDELAHAKIDMLVSDIGMPGLSGYDLIGTIRRSRRRGRLPALAVSAYAGTEDAKKAIDAGFQVHLAKPVDIDHLVGAVARLCGPQVLRGASPR
jgi:CheY-like chemotaxis protein